MADTLQPLPRPSRKNLLAGTLLVMALALLMPNSESLWIDEVATIRFVAGSFSDLLHRLATDRDSLAQMPLGVLAAWGWIKLGVTSEWGLRLLNSLWVIAGAWAMAATGRRLRLPLLPLWFCLQPFLWFYANEFRPYALQIAGSAWTLHGLTACLQERGRGSAWAWSLMLGGFVMAGAMLLGAIPLALAMVILAGAFHAWGTLPERRAWLPVAVGLLLLLPLATHDLATLIRGAGGARAWSLSLLNPLFAGYELLGFSGLGPARLEMREAAREGMPALLGLFTSSLISLLALALLYGLLLRKVTGGSPDPRRPLILAVAGLAAGTVLVLLCAAWAVGWPFWGRHLSPLLPLTTCLTAWAADRFARVHAGRRVAWLVPALLALLLLASSLTLKFSPRHRKDDYRRAVALAMTAAREGTIVWWSADPVAADHYGLVANRKLPGEGGIVYLLDNVQAIGKFSDPGLVLTSKSDLFDRKGSLAEWLHTSHYRVAETFPGFTVWTQP